MTRDDLDRLSRSRVVVIGDVMLDEYVWGDVRRISPEAPVPVVDVRERTHVAGGAANVAAGIVALEAQAWLGGIVGGDLQGERLVALLEEAGVSCAGVVVDPQRPTTTKTRVIAHSQQVVRTDVEQRGPLSEDSDRALVAWARSAVEDADVVVVSDYAKGVVSVSLAREVIGAARAAGKPVVVDPKGYDYGKYAGATVLTPNVHDAKRAAGFAPDEYVDLRAVGAALGETLPDSALLITQGARGMTLISDSALVEIAAQAHEVFDVTGAGDTVVATMAVALGSGASAEEAARLANLAAGIVVSKVGTSTVTLAELRVPLPQPSLS